MAGANGETELDKLLAGLTPLLHPEEYVYCSLPAGSLPELPTPPLATFREEEGTTLVLHKSAADAAALQYGPVMRCITLQVHSSLEAVGLTATVAGTLADAGISANVIAAYHHDHVFVPAERATEALSLLQSLAARAGV